MYEEGEQKRGVYNNRNHPQQWKKKKGKPGSPEKGERLLGCKRSWEFPSSGEGPFLLGTLGRPVLCIFHPRNKPSPHQNPTFGPILYKFIVMGPVRKPRPYKYISKNTNFLYAFNNKKIKNIQNVNMFL